MPMVIVFACLGVRACLIPDKKILISGSTPGWQNVSNEYYFIMPLAGGQIHPDPVIMELLMRLS